MCNQYLLSICIPIYNRIEYLKMMIERFMEDKELFSDGNIHLYISDNCSEDDIQGLISQAREDGLRLEYNRNDENLGMDGNFANCFNHVKGRYVWLLGSDDIPQVGQLREILEILRDKQFDALFLKECKKGNGVLVEYSDSQKYLRDISYYITFMSGNIVASRYIKEVCFEKYQGTLFTEVPLYLTAATSENAKTAIYYIRRFEDVTRHNGGYAIFDIFIRKFLRIYREFNENGRVSTKTYMAVRKALFKEFVLNHAYRLLVLKESDSFEVTDAWKIISEEYRHDFYFYYYPLFFLCKKFVKYILTIR